MCYFSAASKHCAGDNALYSIPRSSEKWAKKGGAPTKSEVLTQISKDTALSRKQGLIRVRSLGGVIKKSLRGDGLFTMPGLMK